MNMILKFWKMQASKKPCTVCPQYWKKIENMLFEEYQQAMIFYKKLGLFKTTCIQKFRRS